MATFKRGPAHRRDLVMIANVMAAKNSYEVLGVPRGASLAGIKQSHRALVQWLHPDRNVSAEAVDAIAKVNVAWDELSDPKARKRLDTLLHTSTSVCKVCRGSGMVMKQKGFTAKTVVACTACGGRGE